MIKQTFMARRKEVIPDPNSPGALSVSDGTTRVGTVVERDHSWFSFGIDGVLIGEYASMREAMRAVPNQQIAINPKNRRSRARKQP